MRTLDNIKITFHAGYCPVCEKDTHKFRAPDYLYCNNCSYYEYSMCSFCESELENFVENGVLGVRCTKGCPDMVFYPKEGDLFVAS